MKKQKTSVERMREFFSFMLCRQAEELAAYAQDLLSEGLITPAEVDELNKSVLLAFGMTGEESAKVRERIVANLRKAETAAREKVLECIAGRYLGGIYEKLRVYVPGSYAAFKSQAKALDQCLITNDYPTRVAKGVCVLVFIERAGKPLATAELIPSGKGWRVGQFYLDERKKDYLAGPAERSALKAWAKANKLKLEA